MPRFRDQAICIRELDWSETSELVVLMTRERGKIRGLAKGARRMSPSSIARFSGGIDLLSRGEVLGVTRSSSELATLTEWDLQRSYWCLRRDLSAQRLAMYAADLTDAMMQPEDPHPRTFQALSDLLEGFERIWSERPADQALHYPSRLLQFQWALLEDAGYRPELERDVHRNTPLRADDALRFDPQAGGLTREQGDRAWGVRRQTAELLRAVAGGESLSHADASSVKRANRLLGVYVRWLLGRELPTMPLVLGPDYVGGR